MNTILTFFKREFAPSPLFQGSVKKRLFSLFSSLVIFAFVIALECFLAWKLFDHLKVYSGVNWSLFSVLLFAFFLLSIFILLPFLNKRLYASQKERYIVLMTPVHPFEVFIGKNLYAYLFAIGIQLITSLPIALCYGIFVHAGFVFYLVAFFEVILIPFAALGVVYLLLPLYNEINKFLKSQQILLLLFGIAIMYLLALLYSQVLNLFVNLLQGGSLDELFTVESLNILRNLAVSLYPTSAFTLVANEVDLIWNIPAIILLPFAFLLFGIFGSYFHYRYSLTNQQQVQNKERKIRPFRSSSPTIAFLKKEFLLTFKEDGNMASYVVLVIVQPFLIYLVVSTLNVIFSTGNLTYIRSLFPNIYSSIDALCILLFLSIINSMAASSLTREKKTIPLLKVLPYSPAKQMMLKLLVPFLVSSFSYLSTCILLCAMGEIAWSSFIYVLIMGLLLIGILLYSGLYVDFLDKGSGSAISIVLDFLFPVLFVLLASLLTLIPTFKESLEVTFYVSLIAMEGILFLLLLIKAPSRINRLFYRYEGGNEL